MMAAEMQQVLGGSVFVENKGGAGGNIGYGFVARSEPDGYTILLTTSAYVVNPSLYNSIPYDPFKDFVRDLRAGGDAHVFAVKSDLPAKNMKEFVALVKKNPDKFNVSTPPIGTTPQLQAEVLKLREGLQKMATVVFNGGGDAVKAVLANTVQLNSGTLAPALPQIQAGTLRALAQTGEKRFVGLPDVPTMVRAGLQGLRVRHLLRADGAGQGAARDRRPGSRRSAWTSWPSTDFKKKLVIAGFDVTAKDAKGHAARIAKEIPMFKKIIEDAGISQALAGRGPAMRSRLPQSYATECGPIVTVPCEFFASQQIAMRLGIDYGVRCGVWDGGCRCDSESWPCLFE